MKDQEETVTNYVLFYGCLLSFNIYENIAFTFYRDHDGFVKINYIKEDIHIEIVHFYDGEHF